MVQSPAGRRLDLGMDADSSPQGRPWWLQRCSRLPPDNPGRCRLILTSSAETPPRVHTLGLLASQAQVPVLPPGQTSSVLAGCALGRWTPPSPRVAHMELGTDTSPFDQQLRGGRCVYSEV